MTSSSFLCTTNMALNGRVAVVTGAALGIGKAMTEILLHNGAKVKYCLCLTCCVSCSVYVCTVACVLALDRPSPVQVVILDVNETTGKSLKEALDKQYEPERTVFLSCDVESEQQVKGKVKLTLRFCFFFHRNTSSV